MTKLNKNHLHIVSRYFNSIDDFVHLEMGVKSCRGNLERFKYNPVSINDQTIKLFPNIKVMHIYREEDKILQLTNMPEENIFNGDILWELKVYR